MGCFADYVYAGAVYFGKSIYQFVRDGEVFCDGEAFAIRGKTEDAKGFPSVRIEKIDTKVVSQLLKKNVNGCTRELADKFRLKLQTARIPTSPPRENSSGLKR